MGKYKDKDTSGWEETSVGAATYDANYTLNQTKNTTIKGQNTSKKEKATLKITTNIENGNYEVKKTTNVGETVIYSYDASTNKKTVKDSTLYGEFFAGSSENDNQLKNLNLNVKTSTLSLTDKNRKNYYSSLIDKDGYGPLENNTEASSPSANTSDKQTDFAPQPANTIEGDLTVTTTDSDVNASKELQAVTVAGGATEFREPIANRGTVYRYPREIPNLGYDFIKITAYNYVASGLPTLRNQRTSDSSRVLTDPLETVILPLQPNISTSQSVDWGGDKLDAVKGTLAELASDSIKSIAGLDMMGVLQALGEAGSNFTMAISDPATEAALIAYFAGQAVGANVQGRTTGNVINPNLELLFTGPRLRTFQFNFRFTPRDEVEAMTVRKIIKTFKRNFSPQRSTTGLFLKTPRVFQIEYIFNNEQSKSHPFLNKIKPCAMTSFNVNYTPDGSYSTYQDGSMTSYGVSMSFGELQPIYADEYDSTDDMGF